MRFFSHFDVINFLVVCYSPLKKVVIFVKYIVCQKWPIYFNRETGTGQLHFLQDVISRLNLQKPE